METQETFPRIISVDDHAVEPPHVWRDRLPSRYRDTGPRIVRAPLKEMTFLGGKFAPVMGAKGDDGPIGDWWVYEDLYRPLTRLDTAVGHDRDEMRLEVITYEQMRPGSFSVPDRLADMDVNHVQSALCFPTFPRFCGQTFTEAADKVTRPPPEVFAGHVFGRFFDDAFGLRNLDAIGAANVLYETDHPHSDSTWPKSKEVGEAQRGHLSPDVVERIVRGNAIDLPGLTPEGLWWP